MMEPAPRDPVNVAASLRAMAEAHPHRIAVAVPTGRDRAGRASYSHFTFAQLDEESDRLARGLGRIGVTRGMRTVLMVTPGLDFFALTFALFKIGAVIVMVDPGMGVRNLKKCLAESEPEAFIGIPKAHAARVLLRWAAATLEILVTVGPRRFWGGWRAADLRDPSPDAFPMCEPEPGETAAILFTSGSTGVPKGAVYTHGIFSAQVRMLRESFGFAPGEVDLATFPLFALFDAALGVTAVIPEMDASRPAQADPRRIIEAITDFGATNMFASPALLDRVGRFAAAEGITLPSLRRVLSAGAPVAPAVLDRFRRALDDEADIFTPYGATESLPLSVIESREILSDTAARTAEGRGICVGRTVAGMNAYIIKITDEPVPLWVDLLALPNGQIGEIVAEGPVVTREYHNRPEQTALAKIHSPDRTVVYHRMGDLGYIDRQGRLWFCGRKSHRVITSEGTLYTIPCEAIFNQHPAVFRTALVGIGAAGSQEPVLCVELEAEHAGADTGEVRRELADLGRMHEHTCMIRHFLFHPGFPVDVRHNAKIGREILAVWAAEQLAKGRRR